ALFRFRQFFASYRIDEYAFVQQTFDDFRGIIWDFVDQLAEELAYQQAEDNEIKSNLEQLKEAVEANSIEALRTKSRHFIDAYMEFQTKRDSRRTKRMESIKKNL